MVSDAVSSSHGRQEYGTAALAPEELRRAYREVAGRREAGARRRGATPPGMRGSRSEEHTSELQSRLHLVCRLLLEKKKKKKSLSKYEERDVNIKERSHVIMC